MTDNIELFTQATHAIAVSPNEAARLCSIGRTTLYHALSKGELKSVKIGTRRLITIDAIKGEISVALSDEDLAERVYQPRETIYTSGALWKYAQLVGSTRLGAVTHPGAKDEAHVYADL